MLALMVGSELTSTIAMVIGIVLSGEVLLGNIGFDAVSSY